MFTNMLWEPKRLNVSEALIERVEMFIRLLFRFPVPRRYVTPPEEVELKVEMESIGVAPLPWIWLRPEYVTTQFVEQMLKEGVPEKQTIELVI